MAPTPTFVPCGLLASSQPFIGHSLRNASRAHQPVAARCARRALIAAPRAASAPSLAAEAAARVTEAEVERAQHKWAAGVLRLGELRGDRAACEAYADAFVDAVYAFGAGRPVLFKPTRAAARPFRPTKADALSYFIAGDARACAEDAGFVLSPPWKRVRFENAGLVLEEKRALAMGHYYFTDHDGVETKVEYTFGYTMLDGELKVDLHHSSLPFTPAL